VVEPISPSRETRIGVCRSTWSALSASAKNAFICRSARALRAPPGAFQTT
jgi:hypothetical protein